MDAPIDLYNEPQILFVAGFIGFPKMNFFTGWLAVAVGGHTLGVRPKHFGVDRKIGLLSVAVKFSERLGSDISLHVAIEAIGIVIACAVGDAVYGTRETV